MERTQDQRIMRLEKAVRVLAVGWLASIALIAASVEFGEFESVLAKTIAAGLALLRRDLEWAGRLSAWAKRKLAARRAPPPAAETPPKASLAEETNPQDGG